MSGMSRLELQTRMAEAGHRTPIIFVSASRDPRKRHRAMKGVPWPTFTSHLVKKCCSTQSERLWAPAASTSMATAAEQAIDRNDHPPHFGAETPTSPGVHWQSVVLRNQRDSAHQEVALGLNLASASNATHDPERTIELFTHSIPARPASALFCHWASITSVKGTKYERLLVG
jgi:hypothetical protein